MLGSTKEGGYRASNKKVSISIGHKINQKRKSRQEQFYSLNKQVWGSFFNTLILLFVGFNTMKENREKDLQDNNHFQETNSSEPLSSSLLFFIPPLKEVKKKKSNGVV